MLIPSIDLMGGKIVQLVQGEKKALEFDGFAEWVERFSKYPLVQLVDLDAAMGTGSNRRLVADFCRHLRCQVGGGIRSLEEAQAVFNDGAKNVIFGSSLVKDGSIDLSFARELNDCFGNDRLVFAVDARGERVAIHGWKTTTSISPSEMIEQLEPFCSAFLYTHIETEGLMRGIPLETVRRLRQLTSRRLIAAGGITGYAEIEQLESMGVDAVVGMAIYSGMLSA